MDRSRGRTYALTDPNPPTTGEVVEILSAYLGRRPVKIPLPLGLTRAVVGHVPGMEKLLGLPAEALDYLASQTTYSTTNAVADLEGTGVQCPPFSSYAERLLDYWADAPGALVAGHDLSRHLTIHPHRHTLGAHREHQQARPDHQRQPGRIRPGLRQARHLLDTDFHLRRIGTNGDVAAAEELVREWADEADVIAVTGLREARVAGLYDGDLEAVHRVKQATRLVPVTDGHGLRDVLQEWAIRHVQSEMPGYYTNARVVVLGGMNHARTIRILQEYTQNFEFADPLLRMDMLNRLDANPLLDLAANVGMWPVRRLPGPVRSQIKAPGHRVSNSLARRALADAHVVVGTYEELEAFGVGDLRGKSVVTSSISDERLAEIAGHDVDMVLDSTPQPFDFTITAAVLEAMMLAASSSSMGRADERRSA